MVRVEKRLRSPGAVENRAVDGGIKDRHVLVLTADIHQPSQDATEHPHRDQRAIDVNPSARGASDHAAQAHFVAQIG